MRLRKVITIVGMLWCIPRASIADWGSHALRPNIKLYEPNQRAIIAWNESEEILLLSADIRASEKTQVLKVIPFPSEPEVKEGDMASFEKAITII
ncbi:MAG: DUF2330 domain-containing protein, partial [Armatimonadetes bacterium]|nr:DUF2330 domain-containing protein [Armatimonadota bacterium]